MIKLSPEDAVVSILSEEENDVYENWLKTGEVALRKAVLMALSSDGKALFNPKSVEQRIEMSVSQLKNQLEKAIETRKKGAKNLSLVIIRR